jgi:hypothetical protein
MSTGHKNAVLGKIKFLYLSNEVMPEIKYEYTTEFVTNHVTLMKDGSKL